MSKLEELIKELCPNGVEYKTLEEVCKFQRGQTITAKETIEGEVPVIAGGQKPAYYHNKPNRIGETIAIAGSGAYAGYISYWTIPVFLSDSFSVNPDNSILRTKYVYYFLESIQIFIYGTKKGSGVPHVHGSSIAKFKIPVPPMEVQCEIVRILDNFTELTAELTARKKQYEYYRDQLLTFDKNDTNVVWKTLQEVLTIKNGKNYKTLGLGDIPVYGTGGIMCYVDTFAFDKPSVLIPRKGSIDKLYYVDIPFWTVDTIFYTDIDVSKVIPKYIYYYLQKEHLEKLNTAGGVPSLTQAVLNKVTIPVPSLKEQSRIVSILDRFDKLCNDISEGLPAEIETRKKQYEYYRDKLLTFKEVS